MSGDLFGGLTGEKHEGYEVMGRKGNLEKRCFELLTGSPLMFVDKQEKIAIYF